MHISTKILLYVMQAVAVHVVSLHSALNETVRKRLCAVYVMWNPRVHYHGNLVYEYRGLKVDQFKPLPLRQYITPRHYIGLGYIAP